MRFLFDVMGENVGSGGGGEENFSEKASGVSDHA